MQVNSPSKLSLRLNRAITYRTVDFGGAVPRGGHVCADGGGEGARGREMLGGGRTAGRSWWKFRRYVWSGVEGRFPRPTSVPIVNTRLSANGLRHVAPWRTAVEHPEDPVEDDPMVVEASASTLMRKQWLGAIPRFSRRPLYF